MMENNGVKHIGQIYRNLKKGESNKYNYYIYPTLIIDNVGNIYGDSKDSSILKTLNCVWWQKDNFANQQFVAGNLLVFCIPDEKHIFIPKIQEIKKEEIKYHLFLNLDAYDSVTKLDDTITIDIDNNLLNIVDSKKREIKETLRYCKQFDIVIEKNNNRALYTFNQQQPTPPNTGISLVQTQNQDDYSKMDIIECFFKSIPEGTGIYDVEKKSVPVMGIKIPSRHNITPASSEIATEVLNYLQKNKRNEITYNDVVNYLICITQGYITTFAGQPGTGKTSLCCHLAAALGLKQENPNNKNFRALKTINYIYTAPLSFVKRRLAQHVKLDKVQLGAILNNNVDLSNLDLNIDSKKLAEHMNKAKEDRKEDLIDNIGKGNETPQLKKDILKTLLPDNEKIKLCELVPDIQEQIEKNNLEQEICDKELTKDELARTLELDVDKIKYLLEDEHFIQISVERGWTSHKDFIGYCNPLAQKNKSGEDVIFESNHSMCELVNKFEKGNQPSEDSPYRQYPYLVLLDEANLSPIEHYWAAFLRFCDQESNKNKELSLGGSETYVLPDSLHFLATVNFDHTTEELSPRFLDRTWVIYLDAPAEGETEEKMEKWADSIAQDSAELERTEQKQQTGEEPEGPYSFKKLKDAFGSHIPKNGNEHKRFNENVNVFKNIVKVFQEKHMPLSPRVCKMVLNYLAAACRLMESHNEKEYFAPLDYAVSQKVLPTICGMGVEYKELIIELAQKAGGDDAYVDQEDKLIDIEKLIEKKSAKLGKTYTHLKRMFDAGKKNMDNYQFFVK